MRTGFWGEQQRDYVEDLNVDGRIRLKYILQR